MLERLWRSLVYWISVLRLALESIVSWGIKHFVGFLIAVAILGFQIHYKVFTTALERRWLSIAWPYLAALVIGYLFHVARAAWQMHEGKQLEIDQSIEEMRLMKESHRQAIRDERAAARAFLNEHHEVKRQFESQILSLTQQLEMKAPEVRIGFQASSMHHGFTVVNGSMNKDAENITAELLDGDGYILNFKVVPVLPKNMAMPLELSYYKTPSGDIVTGTLRSFVITAVGHTTEEWPIHLRLRLMFSDAYASYDRIVDVVSHWPAFGLGYGVTITHEKVCLVAPTHANPPTALPLGQ